MFAEGELQSLIASLQRFKWTLIMECLSELTLRNFSFFLFFIPLLTCFAFCCTKHFFEISFVKVRSLASSNKYLTSNYKLPILLNDGWLKSYLLNSLVLFITAWGISSFILQNCFQLKIFMFFQRFLLCLAVPI